MSVDTTAPEATDEAGLVAALTELINTMPEPAAHEIVSLLMNVEASARETSIPFEVQHKETALETVKATAEAYPEVVATVMDELLFQLALAELVAALGIV